MLFVILVVAALVVGGLIASLAGRVAFAILGGLLLLFGVAVFAVRLAAEGPYAFPIGMDLVSGISCLVLGSGLARLATRRAGDSASVRAGRLLLVVAPLALLFGLAAALHEAEEVALIRFHDADGVARETRLWVVDREGVPWVMTGTETRFGRAVAAHPEIEMIRGGAGGCYRVQPVHDLATIREVSLDRRAKYRAERFAWAVGFPRLSLTKEQVEALQPGGSQEGVTLPGVAAYRLEACTAE